MTSSFSNYEQYLKRLIINLEKHHGLLEEYVDLETRTAVVPEQGKIKAPGLNLRILDTEEILPLERIIAKYPRFVLIGEPGAGKTTTLRHLTLQAAKTFRKDNWAHRAFPLFLRLPSWANLSQKTLIPFADFLLHEWDIEGLPNEDKPLQMLRSGSIQLYLDGLNEMGKKSDELAKELNQWLHDNEQTPVIVTCRASDFTGELKLDLPVVSIEEMNEAQIRDFANKYLDPAEPFLERILPTNITEQEKNTHSFLHLAKNPYLLSALITIYQNSPNTNLPRNNGLLFQTLTKYLWQRESLRERQVGATDWVAFEQVETAFAKLAFAMIDENMPVDVPINYAMKHLKDDSLLEGGQRANFIDVNGNKVRFYHQLIQEYFAAVQLKKLSSKTYARLNKIRFYCTILPIIPILIFRAIKGVFLVLFGGRGRYFAITQHIDAMLTLLLGESEQSVELLERFPPLRRVFKYDAYFHRAEQKKWHQSLIALCGLTRDLEALTGIVLQITYLNPHLAIEAITSGLNISNEEFQCLANAVLKEIEPYITAPLLAHYGKYFRDTIAVHQMLDLLKEQGPYEGRAAVEALSEIGDPIVVPQLITLLARNMKIRPDNEPTRKILVEALGKIGDPRAVPYLLEILSEKDWWFVYRAARYALANIGGEEAINGLLKLLKNDPEVDQYYDRQIEVATALAKLGGQEGLDYLEKGLFVMHMVGPQCATALVYVGTPAVVAVLSKALKEGGVYLGHYAEALKAIGTPETENILQDFYREVLEKLNHRDSSIRLEGIAVTRQLGELIKSTEIVPALAKTLLDENPEVKEKSIWAVQQIHDPLSTPELIAALDDKSFVYEEIRMCDEAARTLERIGTPEALAAVENWKQHQD